MAFSSDRGPHYRLAGTLYLLIIACGIFSEGVVRSSLIVQGDAVATAGNILSAPALFQAGFASDVLMLLNDVAIAVVFYQLFRPVSRTLALAAMLFRMMQASIIGVSLLAYYGAYLLLSGITVGGEVSPGAIQAWAMWLLVLHGHGYDLALIFFAFSCFAMGQLMLRLAPIPSLLGHGMTAAGVVYLLGSAARFLAPEYHPYVTPGYIVPLVAELSFALWLVVHNSRRLLTVP